MNRNARARYSVSIPVTPVGAQDQVDGRADRTEDQLTRWRSTSARRKRAYELAQWVKAEQARRRRQRWINGVRGAVTTMIVLAICIGAIAVNSGPDAEARSPGVAMHEDSASDASAASPILVTTAEIHHDLEPARRLPPPQPPAREVEIRPAPGPGSDVVGVDLASVAHWTDDDYRWVSFTVDTREPTWIRWTDPSGARPIEDMPCAYPTDGAHQCRAGRSHWRIASALRDGAQSGTWTIEACVGDVCQVVDTVEMDLG